jgi:hypothetical protein
MRGLRRYWTNRLPIYCSTIFALGAAVLVGACDDSDRGPTAPTGSTPGGSMLGGGSQADLIGETQTDLGTVTDPPEWIGSLLTGSTFLQSEGSSTQEELPGLGHKFELRGAMSDDQDPQNMTNDVISFNAGNFGQDIRGSAVRNLPPGIKITALDHQINLKYYFPARTCQNGGPRIQLAIDRNGDGVPDGNAFGYVGHAAFGAGCITGDWDIMDMTDNVGRWDLSQLGGGMAMTWDLAEQFVMMTYPNHKVLSGSLVDDGCAGGGAGACGQAYYDLVTIENRTLENDQDTVN